MVLGSTTQYKSLEISHTDYDFSLQFLDLMLFTGPGELREIAKTFKSTVKESKEKGIFPYDILFTTNCREVLSSKIPFKHDDFYNSVKDSNITTERYNEYLEEMKLYKTNLDYLLHYNEYDVEIMVPIVDDLIKRFYQYDVDMLRNVSLSACASQVKYAFAYKEFDMNKDYNVKQKHKPFILSEEGWKKKVESYISQDKKAKRDFTNNVSVNDYKYYKQMFLTEKCYMCHCHFSHVDRNRRPTLDRIDNNIGHTKDNVLPCCIYCNTCKSNRDEKTARLHIQLRKYALLKGLPITLQEGDEELYYIIRSNITGGLSNVHNRINIKGVSTIKNLIVNDKGEVEIIDRNYVITHIIGIDFNSLYPSSFSGLKHPFNKYTNNILYMPGYTKFSLKVSKGKTEEEKKEIEKNILKIINKKRELFIVSLKGHCVDLNKVINFPPIIRNVDIKTDKETIGETTYNYMIDNNMSTNTKVRKLTQLTDTHDKFMVFSSYYLWFLIDTCGFVIDEVKDMYVFTKHTAFKGFVNEFMKKRQKSKFEGDDAGDMFYKIALNGSYGYDIMNCANFSHSKLCDTAQTFSSQLNPNFISTRKLAEDNYQVEYTPKSYSCNTSIIQGFFTLDNAKFWYLNFIYNFMYKCLDMTKIHFVEGDTDSMYFAIAGDCNEDNKQGFKHVIIDEKFYNDNVYKFFPSNFYSTNNSNPKFKTGLEKKEFDKKLGGVELEKQCDAMIALAPKMYSCLNLNSNDFETLTTHVKGVSKNIQSKITPNDFVDMFKKQNIVEGTTIQFQLIKGIMSKIEQRKNFLTLAHTKYKVSKDLTTCTPLFISTKSP
jgi:hypothetical protein